MSCPTNRPGLVAAGARQCHQADQDKTRALLMNFLFVWGFLVCVCVWGGLCARNYKHHQPLIMRVVIHQLYVIFSTIKWRNIINKKAVAQIRFHSSCQWANCTLMKLIKSQTGEAFSITAVILL